MKIAISTDSEKVSEHFGRCPQFTILDIEEKKIVKKETIDNPGHSTGSLPKYFRDLGVECVIAGGAGFRAKQFFDDFGIKLITGIQGTVDEVIENFLNGTLEGNESTCKPGAGKGYGLDKEDSNHKH